MTQYFIFYAESNIVCLIIFGIMLLHNLFNVDRQEKQIKYDRALIAFMLYFLSDTCWAAVIAGFLPRNLFTVVAINFANYILMAAITYRWLNYVQAVEQVAHRERKINRFAVLFPFYVATAALIATYLFAPQVLLDGNLELRPVYNVFLVTVPIIYILAVIFYSAKRALTEKSRSERKRHLFVGLFPLLVIGGGLVQMVALPSTPIFCFCCTILMLVFYIESMEAQISMDPLTRLNNREQLLRYVSLEGNLSVEGRLTYVVMIDINDFKKINDTYGHAEGDRALLFIADALRQAVKTSGTPAFLGRFGGDEFILVVHPVSESELADLIRELRRQIEERCRREGVDYVLSVAVGYDRFVHGEDTFQLCLQRADRKQYMDKAAGKARGQTTVCA